MITTHLLPLFSVGPKSFLAGHNKWKNMYLLKLPAFGCLRLLRHLSKNENLVSTGTFRSLLIAGGLQRFPTMRLLKIPAPLLAPVAQIPVGNLVPLLQQKRNTCRNSPRFPKAKPKGKDSCQRQKSHEPKRRQWGQGISTNPFSTCPKMCSSDNHLEIYYVRIMHPQSFFPTCVPERTFRTQRSAFGGRSVLW